MRRQGFILLALCWISMIAQAHTYVESSVLKSGNIIKLQVNSTGLYGLSYDQIQAMGLNPQKVRILGYGGNLIPQNFSLDHLDDVPSVPFYMQLGSDGVFSSGDYIIFYANGPVGWECITKNRVTKFQRTRNCYADYGCYFISDAAGEQKIIQEGEVASGSKGFDVYTYTALQLHEVDRVNLVDVNSGQEGGGREWYGETITSQSSPLQFSFSFNNVDLSKNLICYVDAAATSSSRTTMKVKVADAQGSFSFSSIPVSDFYSKAMTGNTTIQTPPKSNSIPVTITYSASGATAYLNYIEMQVPCVMKMQGNYLMIRNIEHFQQPQLSMYHLLGADANTQIWNMTNPASAYIVPTEWEGDTLCWLGRNDKAQLFIAVNTNAKSWSSPASRGRVSNQDIHQRIRGKQHIIIAPDEFRYPAEQLKTIHERYNPSEQWCVVSEEEVFNEFSSGTPDASAYRWMMKYLYDTYKGTDAAPKTLLLFGDGTFDNRKLLSSSSKRTLLTYQAVNSTREVDAYATDDYFGWLEDKDGVSGSNWDDRIAKMRIGVGRLPANTYDEACAVVDKLAKYIANYSTGSWKQHLCYLADDGDEGMHVTCADTAAQTARKASKDFIIDKIYLDSYVQETSASGESYPVAYNTFCNLLQTGVLFMDYAGHGSANNICNEMFLTRKQVEAMNNDNQGLWALATCNFAHFDQTAQSTAEVAVLNSNGGAIGVIAADRTVYASENEILNRYLSEQLFYHTDPFTYPNTIGEALYKAKNKSNANVNKLTYVLLGDPSVKLNYPCQYQIVLSERPDTVRALQMVTLKGYISNGSDTVKSYNGLMSITVFDKQQTVATRDNDAEESKKVIRYFQDFPYKLFVGETDVRGGQFTIQFLTPRDIRYNIGLGRIAMYATGVDENGPAEAMGHDESFRVGGSSSYIIDDKEGPNIHIYLNNALFRDGDNVNPSPHFYAELSDPSGINAAGAGIGHDLQLVVDNSPKYTYVLNNYYSANNNSYQGGTVDYKMTELTDGYHTLTFRAWDLVNNPSSATIGFNVNSEMGPNVKSLLVYPVPVSRAGTLYMDLQVDRPDEDLQMELAFFDLQGHKIWSTYQDIYGQTIAFDMSDSPLQPGSYIYQFTIQTNTQSSEKYNGHLIVY